AAPAADLRAAASALRTGLAERRWPYEYWVNACGWSDEVPDMDLVLWVGAVAATISPPIDPGTDIETQSAVAALAHADWLGIVVGLVRRSAGASFTAESAQRDIETLPEIEGESEDPEGDLAVLETAVMTLAPLWQALGVLDVKDRLTELGRWGLPHGLLVTWSGPDVADSEADYEDAPDPGAPTMNRLEEDDAQKVLEVLSRRPMTLEKLRREVAKEGVFASEAQLSSSLIWRPEVFEFDDAIFGHIPTLADQLILTHRLTEEELSLRVLAADLDLNLPGLLALDGYPLAGGGEVKTHFRRDEPVPAGAATGLAGPEGWLADFASGGLIGLRLLDGELAVEPVTLLDNEVNSAQIDLIVREAQAAAELDAAQGDEDYPGVNGTEIVLRARREDPEVFRSPLPPLSEILAAVEGLETHHGYVGVAGTPWEGEPSSLDEHQRAAYRKWRQVLHAFYRDGSVADRDELGALAQAVDESLLAVMAVDMSADPAPEPVAVAMEEAVAGRLSAVPLYLRSRAAEERGDGPAWLDLLERTVAADPSLTLALGDLADLKSVVGDAREALRLYQLAGLDNTTPEVRTLQPFQQPPEGVGRNKPCPCGSGKKYKVCHGRTDVHPLSSRARWLWSKIATFASRGVNREELLDWAELLANEPRDSRPTIIKAMTDPVTMDFTVFDSGLIDEFLEHLGPLLPEDERTLAEQWAQSERRLMEVLAVTPMRGLHVRDLVSGEELDILDRRMSTSMRVKDVVFGRPLDDGSGDLRFQADPLQIPRMMRSRLVALLKEDPEPEDVAVFLAPGHRPQLQTTEGQEMVMCSARYDLADPDAAWQRLSAELEVADSGQLLETAEVPGRGSVVRGRIERQGDRISLETNALERLRELQARVLAADPEARLVDESTRPMDSLLDEQAGAPSGAADALSGAIDPSELPLEVLTQIARQHEGQWLDDHIPALRNRTPREAAADPEIRPELEALLDDLEWEDREHPSPFAMDVARIRKELGLTKS
ncbi:MAG TPA: SEC-C domain-containing protein, partial [Nocardioidaceae bacterium]|nr:SEC-C domain-containing protein [Nocardioidaceae bacterium]